MKHVRFGEIKEKSSQRYEASFFDGKIKSVFSSREEVINEFKKHAEGLLNTHETAAVCVKFTDRYNFVHYILADTLWGERGLEVFDPEPIVFEETEYEYMTNHILYFKNKAYRQVINQRYYSFSDILRAAINWRPWFIILLSSIVSILAIQGALFGIAALDITIKLQAYIDVHSQKGILFNPEESISFSLVITSLTLILLIVKSFSVFYSQKDLKRNTHAYEQISWKKFYKRRSSINTLAMIISIAILSISAYNFYYLLSIDFFQKMSVNSPSVTFVSLINIMVLTSVYMIAQGAAMIYQVYSKHKNLKVYFGIKEREQFRPWFINRAPNITKQTLDSFFFDPKASEYVVLRERAIGNKIIQTFSKIEQRKYFEKALQHFENAKKVYLSKIDKQ